MTRSPANAPLCDKLTPLNRRFAHRRFATTLISVKAGIKHLQDKIENAREDVGGLRTELKDETVVSVLKESEDTLLTLFNKVKANQAEEGAIFGQPEQTGNTRLRRTESIHGMEAIDRLDEQELRENRPYNQRIDLPMPERESTNTSTRRIWETWTKRSSRGTRSRRPARKSSWRMTGGKRR